MGKGGSKGSDDVLNLKIRASVGKDADLSRLETIVKSILHSMQVGRDLCSVAFNCQRGTVVGPMVEGRYPVEVVVSGAKKRIRIRLENLRSVNI